MKLFGNTYTTSAFSLVFLALIQFPCLSGQEPDSDFLQLSQDQLFYRARHVMGQRIPSAVGYFRVGEVFIRHHKGRNLVLEAPFANLNLFYQSGDHLITGQRMAPREVLVFFNDRPRASFEVSGFSFASTVDMIGEKLYIAGSADRERLLFKTYSPTGGVREKVLPFKDITEISDHTILHSMPFQDQWLVWAPSQLELLLFDGELKLVKTIAVAVPERLCQITFDLLEKINRDRSGEPCRQICEEHKGEPPHAIPAGMFLARNRIGLCYVVSLLGGYDPSIKDKPQVDVQTFTECILLAADTFEIQARSEVYPDAFVSGLHGEEGQALGRKWVEAESRWIYQRFPRSNP